MQQADWIIENVNLATMQNNGEPFGKIENALLAVHNKRITWLGKRDQAPVFNNANRVDGHNGWLTPGFIDCHTHLVYAGHRADEFEQRLQGISYAEIAQHGGGINNTVTATRKASSDILKRDALSRLRQLCKEGVTTVEIKSGYGLDLDTELRMLEVAKSLQDQIQVKVQTTYLGAHAIPLEYKEHADDYIDFICEQVLPQIARKKLADAVDVFCEDIGFNLQQCEKVYQSASDLGFRVKGHVEQLSHQGGATLIAKYNGLSADHLEFIRIEEIKMLKQNNVVAVLLPAAFYYLNEPQKPPIKAMRNAKLAMAVATDCNPGSAPMASLLLAMNQACVLFGLTPEESMLGVTRHAAQALALNQCKGILKSGYDADLVLWDIAHPNQLSYSINMHSPRDIWVGGQHV